jgi:uncharacterized RDD family membrane protein YckC
VAQEPATPWGQGTSPWVAPFGATSSSVDASWGFRLGAFLISSVAFVLLCIPFFIAALVVSYDYVQSLFNGSSCQVVTTAGGSYSEICAQPTILLWILPLIPYVVLACYYLIRMSSGRGATLGMRTLRIKVVRDDGYSPLGAGVGVARGVIVAVLLGLPYIMGAVLRSPWIALACYLPMLANVLWPLVDAENKMLHDKVLGTRVVEVPRTL